MAGLYFHIPFCAQRCVYCDFYFVTTVRDRAPFVDALCREIALYGDRYAGREPVETVYYGGGTPSRLSAKQVGQIQAAAHAAFDTSAVAETTFELNPEDATPAYLGALRTMGVDRLSIGVQSFFEEDLRWMNRAHDAEQARRVVSMAREAGFDNVSIDLIFGLPDQPPDRWHANLNIALELAVPHLSTYGLSIEPRTPLGHRVARNLASPLPEEAFSERFRETMYRLRTAGFEHYEVSSFARPGFRAQHNPLYWRHANYLGFGPAAHAFWWEEAGPRRWSNVRSLRRYVASLAEDRLPTDAEETLSPATLADEYVLLRLRTSEGLDLSVLRNRYGVDLMARHGARVRAFEEAGWISATRDTIRLTDAGFLVCDALTVALVG
jgi:oxygen-independent coproporphyrinogen-3 oxidase